MEVVTENGNKKQPVQSEKLAYIINIQYTNENASAKYEIETESDVLHGENTTYS